MREALQKLSDAAFKAYVYMCLNADRRTAQITLEPAHLAAELRKSVTSIQAILAELGNQRVCFPIDSPGTPTTRLEIDDRFWPYEKQVEEGNTVSGETEYVRQVRALFLEPACVQSTFTAADHKIATSLYKRSVSLDEVRRAILLGCARKYGSMCDNQVVMPITSLRYFVALIDEVRTSSVSDSYWEYVRRRSMQLERGWIESVKHPSKAVADVAKNPQ